jgi:hypothetical protein
MTTTSSFKFRMTCAECGCEFGSNKRHAEFCGTPCRKVYNNRRAVRGAELYDLFMTLRFDRKHATDEQLWSHICSLGSAYNTADKAFRGGRRSYNKNAHRDLPLTYSNTSGDGR